MAANAAALGAMDRRNWGAFFVFGVTNNIIYAIFLSAAVDILHGGSAKIPKSTVLIADIVPCILIKMVAPYFVRVVPYRTIVGACVLLDTVALLLVGYPQALYDLGRGVVWVRFTGVLLASLSTGLGETAFLGLTTYFEPSSVVAWSAGTGTAGIAGALYYLLMSSVLLLPLPVITTVALVLPIMMAWAYMFLLRVPPLAVEPVASPALTEIEGALADDAAAAGMAAGEAAPATSPRGESQSEADSRMPLRTGPAAHNDSAPSVATDASSVASAEASLGKTLRRRMRMIRPLLVPFVLPLFLVFYAEYTINQSVYFSLLFPLDQTPFRQYKDHYVTYQALYMVGVFLSRGFGRLLPLMNVWWFTSSQLCMLALLVGACISWASATPLIDDIWVVFGLILVEGLFGGLAYVHAFCTMTRRVPPHRLEFSMAFTSVADSLGIGAAAITCIFLEPYLCSFNKYCMAQRAAAAA